MESSSQVSHFEELRARLLVEYGEFLKASRSGGADGVDPDTGELDGKYRFAGYTAIGPAYAPHNGILFVSLDVGEDRIRRRPEDLILRGGEQGWPTNLHHNGMRLQAAHLLPGTVYRAYLDGVRDRGIQAKEIWNHWRGPGAPAADPLDHAAVTNFYKFVTVGRQRRQGARDRCHRVGGRHGAPEKRLLLGQIKVLRPAHIVFQGRRLPGFLRWPEEVRKEFLELIDAAREDGWSPEIWRSHHPAWRRWRTAGRFVAGTDKWQAEKLRNPRPAGQ